MLLRTGEKGHSRYDIQGGEMIKIIIEVEDCRDCPLLRVDSYNQFACQLFDAHIGTDTSNLTRCKECEEII